MMHQVQWDEDAQEHYDQRLLPLGGRIEHVYRALEDIFCRDPFRGTLIAGEEETEDHLPVFVMRSTEIPLVSGTPEIVVLYSFDRSAGQILLRGIEVRAVSP